MKAVLTATEFADAEVERRLLEDAGFDVIATDAETGGEITEAAEDADALLVQYAELGAATLARLPALRIVSCYGTGVDNIDLEAASRQGVVVANVPAYGGDEVALHATSLILALIRHLPQFSEAVRDGHWHFRATGPVTSPLEMTLGVLGLGRIGGVVAERAGAWFGEVIAHDPYVQPTGDVVQVDIDGLFARADVVSVHVPLSDATRGLVDRRRLRLLGSDGYLVNTARGAVVRTDDLTAALDAGELAGAALDVLPDEPPPADHDLLRHPRVLLTPHVAWYSTAAAADLRHQTAENIIAWHAGSPRNVVNHPG